MEVKSDLFHWSMTGLRAIDCCLENEKHGLCSPRESYSYSNCPNPRRNAGLPNTGKRGDSLVVREALNTVRDPTWRVVPNMGCDFSFEGSRS